MTDDQPTERLLIQQYRHDAYHSRVCARCLALVHTFRIPEVEDIELPVTGNRFGMWLWRCTCTACTCPAVLVSTGPPVEPAQPVVPTTEKSDERYENR
jgi:hypothetical protein